MKLMTLSLATAAAILSFSSVAKTTDITCEDFLEVDYDVVPVVLGYVSAWNEKSQSFETVEVDDLSAIPVDDIIGECKKSPKKKLSQVISDQKAKK